MSGKTAAEPETKLWLHRPVLPRMAIDRPQIGLSRYLERPFRGEAELYAKIRTQQCVAYQIGFQGHDLRGRSERGGEGDNTRENKFFSDYSLVITFLYGAIVSKFTKKCWHTQKKFGIYISDYTGLIKFYFLIFE